MMEKLTYRERVVYAKKLELYEGLKEDARAILSASSMEPGLVQELSETRARMRSLEEELESVEGFEDVRFESRR